MVAIEAGVTEGTLTDGDIHHGIPKGLHLINLIVNIIRRTALVVPHEIMRESAAKFMLANMI